MARRGKDDRTHKRASKTKPPKGVVKAPPKGVAKTLVAGSTIKGLPPSRSVDPTAVPSTVLDDEPPEGVAKLREAIANSERGAVAEAVETAVPSSDEPLSSGPESVGPDPRASNAGLGDLGRYQMLFKLAKGGMGTVYVGRLRGARRFDRLVAIKQLTMANASEEDIDMFLGEARLSARIGHPNVVQTIDVGEQDGVPFLVMDLIQGVSLARLQRRLRKQGDQLDPDMAAWIMVQVAKGLHAAHELSGVDGEPYGLVHRDVSPDNVLLSFDGRVYVADFGVAKFADADRQTQSGVVKGKFAYMSPEQTEAAELDRRSDVFAFGIVLHECLTGRRLYDGRSAADTIRRIWGETPPDPSAGRPEVPKEIVPIVMRCLQRERERRYDSAADVGNALRQLLRSRGAVVDEADVAALLADVFQGRRQRLRDRINDAVRLAEQGAPTGKLLLGDSDGELNSSKDSFDPAAAEHSAAAAELGSVAASVTTGPPMQPTRFGGMWALLGAAALIGGGLWFWLAGAPESTAESSNATAPLAPAASSGVSTPTESPAATSAATTASASPPSAASAATTASASAKRPALPRPAVRTGRTGGTAPRKPPAPPKPAAQPPTSHKGKPFVDIE
jgi:serine/threonine-protein kinase